MTSSDQSSADETHAAGVCETTLRLLKARRDTVCERLEDAARGHGDRVERVHQLRVGSRRAEVALDFLLPWLPSKKAERLRRKLTKLRKATGRVRDGDILRKLLRQTPQEHPGRLKGWLKRRRKDPQKKLEQTVRQLRKKDRLRRLWDDVIDGVRWESIQNSTHEPEFLPWAREQLSGWVESWAGDMPAAIDSFDRLHAFRIAGKRVRYGLELLPEEEEREATSQLLKFLQDMQERLGEICDQETLRLTLERWNEKGKKKKLVRQLSPDEEATTRREDTLLTQLQADWPALQSRLTQLTEALKRDS